MGIKGSLVTKYNSIDPIHVFISQHRMRHRAYKQQNSIFAVVVSKQSVERVFWFPLTIYNKLGKETNDANMGLFITNETELEDLENSMLIHKDKNRKAFSGHDIKGMAKDH